MTVAELLAELVALGLNKPHVEFPEISANNFGRNDHKGYYVLECVVCHEAAQAAVGFTTNTCGLLSCMAQAGEPVDKNVYHDVGG